MSPKTRRVRVAADLHAAAKVVAAESGRTIGEQIAYWARIGRAYESAPGVTMNDIRRVLAEAERRRLAGPEN